LRKRHEFCAECSDFPCDGLKKWADGNIHHKMAYRRLVEMKVLGIEKWLIQNGY
jgi:hypothetical protein